MKKTNLLRILLMVFITVYTALPAMANATQTVRGRIIDKENNMPLPGVNVVIQGLAPSFGTATDGDGYFTIANVPLGRYAMTASFIGYENIQLSNVVVMAGKQTVLNLEMQESIKQVDEVVVAASRKTESLNKMATVSVRTFSVEESERFAGSLGDVSRMATNFAGVQAANDAVNEIVIRGNSPGGLLWRLDGINIPNPNHYGNADATAGPVSMLNNNVMANSDFYTGAFPAEYGNATSGVFDLRMRNGNSEKHEFLGQVGFGGFEFGAEGPLRIGNHASYLINYRYSTLAAMFAMGMPMPTGTAVPYYQDLSGKINIPTEKAGTFSIILLGGLNKIDFLGSKRDTTEEQDNFYQEFESDLRSKNNLGVIGVSHNYIFSPKLYTKIILAAASTNNWATIDSIGYYDRKLTPWYRGDVNRKNLQCNVFANQKLNARNSVRIGADADMRIFHIQEKLISNTTHELNPIIDYDGNMFIIQPYLTWQHKLSENITVNTGLHSQLVSISSDYSIEPRAGVKWQFAPKDRLSLGFGVHTQAATANVYMSQITLEDGTVITPNKNIGLTYSYHYVLGYDHDFSPTMRLKSEIYYQQIDRALVDAAKPSAYSMLNAGAMTYEMADSLANKGTGENYGIELTVEKFLDRGFYLLNTVSLYESSYKGSDGVKRNTAFNGRYVINVLVGKEVKLSKDESAKSRKSLSFDLKYNYAGGKRYSPVDMAATQRNHSLEYDNTRAYELQLADYMRADLRIGFKIMQKRMTQELALDLQNVLNRKNEMGVRYDMLSGEVEKQYQMAFTPMMLYRINF